MWILRAYFWGVLMLLCVEGSPPYIARPRSPLCVRNNAPCASDDSCKMIYFPVNSSACANFTFTNNKTPVEDLTLGAIHFNTYLYIDRTYTQTAFNFSFGNVTWTDMKFRIIQNGYKSKNTCRQFVRSSNSSVFNISYDCVWSDERYEGKTFILNYEAHAGDMVEGASFVFNVPMASGLELEKPKELWQMLVYVQTIPTYLGRTIFNVYWPPAPPQLDVKCYRVYVFYNNSGEEFLMHTTDICHCDGFTCSYTTTRWYGSVRFGVQPIFENSLEGYISKTQYFDLSGDTARPLLFGVVACSILAPIILYSMLLLRNRLVRQAARNSPPKMLIMYSPTTTPHLHVVETLVHYLNTHCRVVAWMDEIDILNSPTKDPFAWSTQAIESADVICVVASPFYGKIRSSSALYRTDGLMLRLLREHFNSSGKTRYCVLMLPYTSIDDVPLEARCLRKLRFPNDLDTLLQFACFRWPIPSCLAPSIPGGQAELGELGRELSVCLQTAADDLSNNRNQYVQQVQEALSGEAKRKQKSQSKDESELESPISETSWLPSVDEENNQDEEEPLNPDLKITRLFLERKKEDKTEANAIFADYEANLDNLNLLGDKEQPFIVPSIRNKASLFNLDALNL